MADRDTATRNEGDEESASSKKARIAIWVAIIGLIGTLGTGVLANLEKIFPQTEELNQPQVEQPQVEPIDPRVAAEKIAGEWLGAWLGGDVDAFLRLSTVPFYFDQEIVLSKADLRSKYLALFEEKGDFWRDLQVASIKVQTAQELKQVGYDLSKDRIFGNMNLSLEDFAVTIMVEVDGREEGVLLVIRRIPDAYEIVGLWD